MNTCKDPLKLTYSEQIFVGYKVSKPDNQSGEYVDKAVADNMLKHLLRLKEILEEEIPEFNIPSLNELIKLNVQG